MPEREGFRQKKQALDLVLKMLVEKGEPLHYTVLMDAVMEQVFPGVEDVIRAKARFLTWLNLDTRFVSAGQGYWGLRKWVAGKGNRRVPLLSLMHKTVDYDDEPHKNGGDHRHHDQEEEASPDKPGDDQE